MSFSFSFGLDWGVLPGLAGEACGGVCAVAVTGLPGSGKSVVARVVAGELGARLVSMGDVVRREARRRGFTGAVGVERFAVAIRRELGAEAVAVLLAREVEGYRGFLVVDGVRSRAEIGYFRGLGWRVVVVAVHSPPGLRYARLLSRGRAGEDSLEALRLRDETNLRLGVGEVIALADFMIVNDSGLEDLVDSARRVAWRARCALLGEDERHVD